MLVQFLCMPPAQFEGFGLVCLSPGERSADGFIYSGHARCGHTAPSGNATQRQRSLRVCFPACAQVQDEIEPERLVHEAAFVDAHTHVGAACAKARQDVREDHLLHCRFAGTIQAEQQVRSGVGARQQHMWLGRSSGLCATYQDRTHTKAKRGAAAQHDKFTGQLQSRQETCLGKVVATTRQGAVQFLHIVQFDGELDAWHADRTTQQPGKGPHIIGTRRDAQCVLHASHQRMAAARTACSAACVRHMVGSRSPA